MNKINLKKNQEGEVEEVIEKVDQNQLIKN